MKAFLSCICFFIIIPSFSQELIPNFEQLSDSTKNVEVIALLLETRSNPSFEDRINEVKEVALFCKDKEDLPTEALAVSYLYIAYIEHGKFDGIDDLFKLIEAKYFDHLLPANQLRLNLYHSQLLLSQGRLDEGIETAQNTLAICEAHQLPKNNVYGLLSTIYMALGKFDEALKTDRQNLNDMLKNQPEEKRGLGQAYYSISRDYTNLEELDSANYYGVLSLGYWGHPVSYIQLGDIKTKLAEYDSARYYLSRAQEVILSSPKWENQKTTLYLYLSKLEILEENWEEGLLYSEQALTSSIQDNDVSVTYKAYEYIIRSHLQDKAYYLDSLLAKDRILRDRSVEAQTIEMDTKYKASEKEKKIMQLSNDVQQREIEALTFRNYLLYTGIAVLALIILVYLLFRIRKSKTEKEISHLKKQALQLQMNPHFFFNSLNSIHNFIGNNEPEEAQKYLVNFSRLMRLTLESSQENLIHIGKEVEFLKNFLILEKLRNKNFDFEIKVEEELLDYKIPGFLIQPLIENSLLHGFSTIDYEGFVQLKIEKEQDTIVVTVIDNGVGRKKSIERKQEKGEHTSFGIELLKKRIYIYSKKSNGILIEDGIAVQGNSGTKITFQLPLFS